MIVHDIGRVIPDEVTLWPGDTAPTLRRLATFSGGSPYALTALSCSCHCGTHIDAPAHFIEGGDDIAGVPIEYLVGPADVVMLSRSGPIAIDELAKAVKRPAERVLFRGGPDRYGETFWLEPNAAEWLVSKGVRLVGTTCMSIDAPDSSSFATHKALLGHGCCVLEHLYLERIAPGAYFLVCAPLKWRDAEASPVRPLLIEGL